MIDSPPPCICLSIIFGEIFAGLWEGIRCYCSCSLVFNMQLLAALSDTFQRSTPYSLQVKLVSSAQD